MAYPNTPNPYADARGTVGGRWVKVHPTGHAGPTLYAPVTTGPLAGGDVMQASELGLKYIDNLDGGITSDGLYRVEPINPVSGPVTSVILRWTVMATGAQAGAINLSGSTVNMFVMGTE